MATEQQITESRRKLYALLGRMRQRLIAVQREPLPPKVRMLADDAAHDLDAWLREAGELVGLELPQMQPDGHT